MIVLKGIQLTILRSLWAEATSKIHRQFRAAHEGYVSGIRDPISTHSFLLAWRSDSLTSPSVTAISRTPGLTLLEPLLVSFGAPSELANMVSSMSPRNGPTWDKVPQRYPVPKTSWTVVQSI